MNTFLVQVGIKGYNTITDKGYYENLEWKRKNKKGNEDHGIVKPGDRLVVYCATRVPKKAHKGRLAFSVDVSNVSDDGIRFEVEKPQFFKNPLELTDITKYKIEGGLDECFGYCGQQWFNITKLEPAAVERLFTLVKP